MRKIGENIDYPTNDEVRFLIEVANLLYKQGKIRSFREFSEQYLGKNSKHHPAGLHMQRRHADRRKERSGNLRRRNRYRCRAARRRLVGKSVCRT